jgi:hypothetical protein
MTRQSSHPGPPGGLKKATTQTVIANEVKQSQMKNRMEFKRGLTPARNPPQAEQRDVSLSICEKRTQGPHQEAFKYP